MSRNLNTPSKFHSLGSFLATSFNNNWTAGPFLAATFGPRVHFLPDPSFTMTGLCCTAHNIFFHSNMACTHEISKHNDI